MDECKVSVLLAAYCGQDYIAQQVASILPQLRPGDELLVGDDSPPGQTATKEAVLAFQDPRIRYLPGPRQGTTQANVEFLLGQARGDILALCDQDDVWLPEKLSRVRKLLAGQPAALLLHDAKLTDGLLQVTNDSLFRARNVNPGAWRNLWKNGYTGCCMALTRGLLPYILPFPKGIPMHDQWIGLQAQRRGRVIFLPEQLILYRRHTGTQTGHGSSLWQKLAWRAKMMVALLKWRNK
jgi:glycosyltransferase involved in cell wall biosynthesis